MGPLSDAADSMPANGHPMHDRFDLPHDGEHPGKPTVLKSKPGAKTWSDLIKQFYRIGFEFSRGLTLSKA